VPPSRRAEGCLGLVGGGLIIGLVATALLAGVIAPFDPAAQIAPRLVPPGLAHPFGTDDLGRDVFSRVVYGARISLLVGVVSVSIALLCGGLIGLASGFFGGWLEALLMRLMDITFAIPTLVLAIAISGVLGPSLLNAMLAIGIVYLPTFARVTRSGVLGVMPNDYVLAARALGATRVRQMRLHVVPNALSPVIVQASLAFSTAILAEATLSFLGLGAQPPQPSWGSMLSSGRQWGTLAPWVVIFPGAAIMLAVLGFNLFGDGLRDHLDPRLRK
jgi:peptide/nickel transport system permease protein